MYGDGVIKSFCVIRLWVAGQSRQKRCDATLAQLQCANRLVSTNFFYLHSIRPVLAKIESRPDLAQMIPRSSKVVVIVRALFLPIISHVRTLN